jgi:hypothetical protein
VEGVLSPQTKFFLAPNAKPAMDNNPLGAPWMENNYFCFTMRKKTLKHRMRIFKRNFGDDSKLECLHQSSTIQLDDGG